MTLLEAIHRLDDGKPNVVPQELKVRWLSELDGLVWRNIHCTHLPIGAAPPWRCCAMTPATPAPPAAATAGTSTGTGGTTTETAGTSGTTGASAAGTADGSGASLPAYSPDGDLDTELLVPAPYDTLYILWLEAQIDRLNGEIDRYNAAITVFADTYATYESDYHRTHPPRPAAPRFLF